MASKPDVEQRLATWTCSCVVVRHDGLTVPAGDCSTRILLVACCREHAQNFAHLMTRDHGRDWRQWVIIRVRENPVGASSGNSAPA